LEPLPVPPEYGEEASWSALPWREDAGDEIPKGRAVSAGPGTADVFYLHPTIFEEGPAWNAPLDSVALNAAVDAWPVRHQAAVFNGAGRVFAPRYRQAHIRVFSVKDSLSLAALKLAYSDIRTSFQHFLDHWDEGRPLIIAAHSQGSWHARWLLQEFFDGTPLQERLVAAYIPGMDIYPSDFNQLQPCQSAVDQQCYCTWMSYGTGYVPPWLGYKKEPPSAIHPVTWTTTIDETNERDDHLGAVRESFRNKNPGSITAPTTSAPCESLSATRTPAALRPDCVRRASFGWTNPICFWWGNGCTGKTGMWAISTSFGTTSAPMSTRG